MTKAPTERGGPSCRAVQLLQSDEELRGPRRCAYKEDRLNAPQAAVGKKSLKSLGQMSRRGSRDEPRVMISAGGTTDKGSRPGSLRRHVAEIAVSGASWALESLPARVVLS